MDIGALAAADSRNEKSREAEKAAIAEENGFGSEKQIRNSQVNNTREDVANHSGGTYSFRTRLAERRGTGTIYVPNAPLRFFHDGMGGFRDDDDRSQLGTGQRTQSGDAVLRRKTGDLTGPVYRGRFRRSVGTLKALAKKQGMGLGHAGCPDGREGLCAAQQSTADELASFYRRGRFRHLTFIL